MKKIMFLLMVICISAQAAHSQSKAKISSFSLSPASIRTRLLSSNTSVLVGLNEVHKAKEEVNVARGNLLPSLNANAMLSVGGIFSWTSVSFLMPFLLPSNWYNLEASEGQLAADGWAFYLVQLNQYASAYTLHSVIVNDSALRDVYLRQAEVLEQVRQIVQDKVAFGQATPTDLNRATAQAKLARNQVLLMEALLAQEIASMRKLLALPLETELLLETSRPEALVEESNSPQQLLDRVFAKAPETKQIDSLIDASRAASWSRSYSFLTGASANIPGGSGGGLSWKNAALAGSAGIGFGYFPNVRLSELQVKEFRLRKTDLRFEQARIIESTLGSISRAVQQLTLTTEAEQAMNAAFDAQLTAFRSGQIDLLYLLDASSGVISSSIARVRAQSDVDSQRISLKRILIDGQFSAIKPCQLKNIPGSADGLSWFSDLFDESTTTVSIDQLCRKTSRK